MDHLAAELDDALEGGGEVGHAEVRERDAVAGAGAARVDAQLGAAGMRLDAGSLTVAPLVELDAEHALPEASCALGVVRGELDQFEHACSLEPRRLTRTVAAARPRAWAELSTPGARPLNNEV